ncbi:GlmL-related ornithine degradation protein [Jeotgalibaca caeni]|uniref:GlmL-related ornithine degradation protein n=1 Tax=Jeotgalibaca caeni TaxID=3028623 RepID=UPI00237D3DCD|nr:GlmL-related ornithine degradation protein [Jeotgalibaca caeni]MDE1547612.1 GlmL-related ornithine degradation protein [Jeotgalibaca caeni]
MRIDVLVAEIGSTTTVVNAFNGIYDNQDPVFVGQGQATTTVEEGDVRIGLENSIDDLRKNLGVDQLTYQELFATSSAAGGLKMTVHGLVFDMTARAAKEAALGAGAVIRMVSAGRLRRTDLKKIKETHPNLILIAGGVDYGERETSLYNAEQIANLQTEIPVIYAGNVENQEEIQLIFEDSNQDLYIVENVYPQIDQLNIEPTRKVIQSAFEKHIVHAPGMEHVYDVVNGTITPTPGAVMNITKLIYERLGDVLVVDVGGATTDVHSVTEGSAAISEILVAPEPKAKRTVEGDLGLYVNMENVMETYGIEKLEKAGFNIDTIRKEYNGIPQNETERAFVSLLCDVATRTAVDRHAGVIRYVYGPTGRGTLAQGKDLSKIKYIIGTGGALTRLANGEEILKKLIKEDENTMTLLPTGEVKVLLDHDYIIASLGILAMKHEEAAIKLLEKSLHYSLPTPVVVETV